MPLKHTLLLLASLLYPLALVADDAATVHHPAPKDPIYLSKSAYEGIKKALPPPPTIKSQEQKMDEKALLDYQSKRTPQDCEAAKGEVLVSLKSFYGAILDSERIEKLAPFFEQVRNDSDYFIQKLKVDFPRKRPFLYVSSLSPCVPREVTGAYPSGHAMLSRLFALILSDLEPQKGDRFESRSVEIGMHRVLSGMHHPSDVKAGRALAALVYGELKKSKKYKEDFLRVSL